MSNDVRPQKGAPRKAPGEVKTQILSVRLPSLEMRRAFAAKLAEDGLAVTDWVAMTVDAYIDGRLRVIEAPEPEKPRPSFLIPAQTEPDPDPDPAPDLDSEPDLGSAPDLDSEPDRGGD